MENIMKKHGSLRILAKKLGNVLKKEYQEYNAVAMIHNHIVMALELCNSYTNMWVKTTGIKEDDLSKEQIERIIMITRDTFIHAMSSCEYCAKNIVLQKNHSDFQNIIDALNRGNRIYLGNIMRKSQNLGIISQKEYDNWDSFREIRNAIVHNNAVSEFDKEYIINGFKISAEIHKQLHTKWDVFPYFVSIILKQFDNWAIALYSY